MKSDIFDLGTIPADSNVEFYLTLTNIGRSTLDIVNVSTDCGCTVAKWDHLTQLEPNQSDSLLVQYDTQNKGAFNRKVIIETNALSPTLVIYVKGTID